MIGKFFKIMFMMIFICAILLCGGYLYARYAEPNMMTVAREDITFDNLPYEAEGLTAVLFSDVHVSNFFPPNTALRKAVDKIILEKPDIVFFTGDLFDSLSTYNGDYNDVTALLKEIDAPYGKFAVYGNHDYQSKTYFLYRQILEEAGFTLLKNQITVLDELKMNIIGLDEFLLGVGSMQETKKVTNDYFNLVLSHEPDVIDDADENVDLMLSGHTHAGQCRIPIIGSIMLPKLGKIYVDGLYTTELKDGSTAKVYVTGGIGMSKLPFRFLTPPEICVLKLKRN